jgi:hypothetical protein
MQAISVKGVSKQFTFKAQRGLKGFFNPEKKSVIAVDDRWTGECDAARCVACTLRHTQP